MPVRSHSFSSKRIKLEDEDLPTNDDLEGVEPNQDEYAYNGREPYSVKGLSLDLQIHIPCRLLLFDR